MSEAKVQIIAVDTITKVPPEAAGAVVVSGSHGGVYPGYLAAVAGVRAVILNDAGVGKDAAGTGSLRYLESLGIAAATVSHLSSRIGDTADMLTRGIISHANSLANALGVSAAMTCRDAAELLRQAKHVRCEPPYVGEGRSAIDSVGKRCIILVDSASLVRPQDAGQIVVTGSHGGLVGGLQAMALQTDAFAAVFNDAGIGIDDAGVTRLPALDLRGIAALTCSSVSARIGDARSTYEDGLVSRWNMCAAALGIVDGARVHDVIATWAQQETR